jgi:hypothetical protein
MSFHYYYQNLKQNCPQYSTDLLFFLFYSGQTDPFSSGDDLNGRRNASAAEDIPRPLTTQVKSASTTE